MKVIHIPGWADGGQKHRVILEQDDGFLRDGSSVRVNLDLFAEAQHTHLIADVTGLQAALDGKATTTTATALDSRVSDLEGLSSAFPVESLTGTLGVDHGGTGTATPFTSGSVLFAGPSGVYAQDNANFFWDNTLNRLGVGTAAPTAMVSLKNKVYFDPTVADSTSSILAMFDTDNAVTSTGFGSSRGFTWASFRSAGTERLRIDWSAGNAIRFYAPGRMDFESAGQVFFTGTAFFFQAHSSFNRVSDASSTGTQRDSYGIFLQNSLWTGAASTQRFCEIRSKASTSVNLAHTLKFFVNVTGGIGTDGVEVLALGYSGSGTTFGVFGATPVSVYSTTGTTTGFSAGAGSTVDSAATFTGNLGSTAYTISDLVRALKQFGFLTQ